MKKKLGTRRPQSSKFADAQRKSPAVSRAGTHGLGALSHKMKDHIYFLRHGYIYTTPFITCRMNMKFYAAILFTSDRKNFSLKIGDNEQQAAAFIIRPGTKFIFTANDIEFVSVFVEPTHALFGSFSSVPAAGLPLNRDLFKELDPHIAEAYQGKLSGERALQLLETALEITSRALPQRPTLDGRVAKAIAIVSDEPKTSLAALAKSLGLSYHRLSHLFTDNLGITLRRFLQWKKVTVTASLLATRSITEAAHEAGFTDSSHLSNTFQDLFGLPPSYLTDARYVRRFFYHSLG